MKRLPLLRLAGVVKVGMVLMLWGLFLRYGAIGVNIETGLVLLGSILYLCTGLRKAA